MKKLLFISIIIGMILFNGCGKTSTALSTTSPPLITVSADQLYKEYQNNQDAADRKYLGKTLEVSGIVKEIADSESGSPYVLLTGGGDNETNGVFCIFPDDYDSILAKLSIGQKVSITGKCTGFDTNVLIDTR